MIEIRNEEGARMKLKKLLLVSTCALTLGTISTMGSSFASLNATTVYAQDQQTDSTLSQEEQDTLVVVKDNLAGVQPINLEQLLEVDDRYLLDLYETVQADSNATEDVWQRIYQQIAADYPQLTLLTGEDYDNYNEVANIIVANSQYSYSDLNTAFPADILSWYNSYLLENDADEQTTVEAILPNITSAREAYIQRREQRESQESPESEQEETANIEDIHLALIQSTPITQEQLDQLDDQELINLVEEGNHQGYDIAWAFNQLIENHPDIFESEVNRFRTALVEEYHLNQDELSAVPTVELLWAEYQIFLNNNQSEDMATLAEVIQDNYGVSTDEEDSSSEESEESTPDEDGDFEQAIAELTDITEDQLAQFTAEELEPFKLTAANGEYNQDVMKVVRNQMIQLNPSVFTGEQVQSVAEEVHAALIASTPILQEQLDQLDNAELITVVGEGNRQGYDIGWTFNSLVENYPELFESEVNRFRTTLVEDYHLNEEELLAVNAIDLLWAEYQAFLDNQQVEDMEALALTLQEDYGVSVIETDDSSSSDESSEDTSDDSSSESESNEEPSDLDRYLETLISETDLTMEQLDNFSDEHIQILMNRLNLTTGSTSAENLQALRDEIVISSYENFESTQLAQAIEPLRQSVINQTPVTEDILSQISDEALADLYNEAKNNNQSVPNYVFQQLVTNQSDLFNDLVIQAKNQITQNTTLTQEQVDQMQFIDLLLAVQPNESGEVNYVDVTNYLAKKYPNIVGNDEEEASESSDEEESSSVNVSISSSVEEKEGVLPNTGESSSIIVLILGAVALVGGGLYLILSGRNKSKH